MFVKKSLLLLFPTASLLLCSCGGIITNSRTIGKYYDEWFKSYEDGSAYRLSRFDRTIYFNDGELEVVFGVQTSGLPSLNSPQKTVAKGLSTAAENYEIDSGYDYLENIIASYADPSAATSQYKALEVDFRDYGEYVLGAINVYGDVTGAAGAVLDVSTLEAGYLVRVENRTATTVARYDEKAIIAYTTDKVIISDSVAKTLSIVDISSGNTVFVDDDDYHNGGMLNNAFLYVSYTEDYFVMEGCHYVDGGDRYKVIAGYFDDATFTTVIADQVA